MVSFVSLSILRNWKSFDICFLPNGIYTERAVSIVYYTEIIFGNIGTIAFNAPTVYNIPLSVLPERSESVIINNVDIKKVIGMDIQEISHFMRSFDLQFILIPLYYKIRKCPSQL